MKNNSVTWTEQLVYCMIMGSLAVLGAWVISHIAGLFPSALVHIFMAALGGTFMILFAGIQNRYLMGVKPG